LSDELQNAAAPTELSQSLSVSHALVQSPSIQYPLGAQNIPSSQSSLDEHASEKLAPPEHPDASANTEASKKQI
jgi:hypothetical protein